MIITLRFVTSDSFISKAIRDLTHSPYSHVEFALPEGYLGAHIDGGVMLRPLDYEKPSAELFLEVDVPDAAWPRIMGFAKAQIGKPYDTSGIFGFIAPGQRDWKEPDSWFCSELVAASFDEGGYSLLRTDGQTCKISPRDVLLSPYLKERSTGV